MATGVQDVGLRRHEPAPGRHRLPDQAVRPRPPARVGRRAASSGTRRPATRAAGAKRSKREVESRRERLRDALTALTIDSDAALDGLLSVADARGSRRLRPRLPRGGAGGQRRRARCGSATDDMAVARARRAAARRRQAGDAGGGAAQARAAHDRGAGRDPPASADRRRPDRRACRTCGRRGARARRARADRRARLSQRHATPRTSPSGARIIAVADAFDAMTRPRVFRDAITPGEALLELERCAGTQFDAGRRRRRSSGSSRSRVVQRESGAARSARCARLAIPWHNRRTRARRSSRSSASRSTRSC